MRTIAALRPDYSQEIVYNDEYREGVAKKIAALSDKDKKALLEKLKTGKGFSKELGAQVGLMGKEGALAGASAASHFKKMHPSTQACICLEMPRRIVEGSTKPLRQDKMCEACFFDESLGTAYI